MWLPIVPWLLMPWPLMSPSHQQPWYWLWAVGSSLSSMRRDLNHLCHLWIENISHDMDLMSTGMYVGGHATEQPWTIISNQTATSINIMMSWWWWINSMVPVSGKRAPYLDQKFANKSLQNQSISVSLSCFHINTHTFKMTMKSQHGYCWWCIFVLANWIDDIIGSSCFLPRY